MNKIEKACMELKSRGVPLALLTSAENVTYLSGFEMPLHSAGLSCIGNGMPLTLVLLDVEEERVTIITCDDFLPRIKKAGVESDISCFTLFGNLNPFDTMRNFTETVRKALRSAGVPSLKAVRIGIEFQTCPYLLSHLLENEFGAVPVDVSAEMEEARSVKTEDEIQALRYTAKLLDAGQEEFNAQMRRESATEYEIFGAVLGAINAAADRIVPVTGELVMGARTNQVKWPGGPIARQVHKGDSAILDISPRIGGYWGDCSNTGVFGREPDAHQMRFFNAVKETFDMILERMKPGAVCSELAALIMANYGKHGFQVPHYCGHQVGVSVNETPRIVPYDHSVMKENMVFCLELGLYEGEGGTTGVRLERMIRITRDGNEVLNQFAWGM
jgi:Xaa-Pro aminopeptidase